MYAHKENLNRPVHALRALWVIRANLQRSKAVNQMFFFIYFRSDFISDDETYTGGGETPILGLPAFLSRSSECCGCTNFFYS